MMIPLRARSRHPHRLLLGALASMGALLVGGFMLFPESVRPLERAAHIVGYPLWKARDSLVRTEALLVSFFRDRQALLDENASLREEVTALRLSILGQELFVAENEELKELLGRRGGEERILAAVLTRPAATPYDTFVIDAGENLGIGKGDVVYAGAMVVLGRVREVYARTSLVSLFSSPGEQTEILLGSPGTAVVALGRGAGNFSVLVPRGLDIKEGDAVTLPGIDPDLFALVEHIEESPADSFKTVFFKNPINLAEVRFVEIAH